MKSPAEMQYQIYISFIRRLSAFFTSYIYNKNLKTEYIGSHRLPMQTKTKKLVV